MWVTSAHIVLKLKSREGSSIRRQCERHQITVVELGVFLKPLSYCGLTDKRKVREASS